MMASQETAAVLGAGGMMGFPMARNLARSGISVRAWNRSRDKAEPLAKDGAQVCDSPAEAAEGASVILTMLADADAVLDVVTGDRGALGADEFGDGGFARLDLNASAVEEGPAADILQSI